MTKIESIKNTPGIIQAWSIAARVRTVPIPTIQVLTGTGLAYAVLGAIDWPLFIYTWLVGVFITMGTNLINDVIDFDNGEGSGQTKRVGFLKVISAGIIPRKHVLFAGLVCFVLTILFGIPLAIHAGWGLFVLILLSVVMGYCYTGGPYPISYLGLSELFILLFYGFLCVGAAYYVQIRSLSFSAILCALQMGLLAILPNALNNFRDMYEDAEYGKRTLAVRFGKTFARWELGVLTFLPFIIGLLWIPLGYPNAALIPLVLTPIAFIFVQSIWKTDPGPQFNRFFGLSLIVHFLFGLFLMVGFLS